MLQTDVHNRCGAPVWTRRLQAQNTEGLGRKHAQSKTPQQRSRAHRGDSQRAQHTHSDKDWVALLVKEVEVVGVKESLIDNVMEGERVVERLTEPDMLFDGVTDRLAVREGESEVLGE